MANLLGTYNPTFFANEALIQLEKALGMASRVHMGFDEERRSFGLGESIDIRRPATFTVQNAPSPAQDVNTETVSMKLDKWKEVKFKLSDKELAFTGERIITDHIRPAAVALADDIDQALADQWYKVPHFADMTGSPLSGNEIPDIRKIMQDNKVPLRDRANMHAMVGTQPEADFLKSTNFALHQGAGNDAVGLQRDGHLGVKYGYEIFANQNTVVSGGVGSNSDLLGTVVGTHSAGSTTLSVTAHSSTGTLKAGDSISVDGAKYAITSDITLSGGAGVLNIFPGLKASVAGGAVTTIVMRFQGTENMFFHKNAFGLVTAPLSTIGGQLGAQIATVQDPITGLSIRSRMYYDGNNSSVHVALDVLYGVQVLDGNLACRMTSDA